MDFATRAIHAGQEQDPSTAAVTPAIHLSSVFGFDGEGKPRSEYDYIRYGNPTRGALEKCLASLEGAPEECPALCYSSGVAAIDGVGRMLRPGERVLIAQDVYGGTVKLAESIWKPAGIETAYADAVDADAFVAAITPNTRLVWLESPSNPLLRITDIATLSSEAHRAGALVAIDSTFATPALQSPLALGVDIVMHSSTKYLGGHSDLLGGALIVRDPELRARLYEIQKATGAVASPFDSWLTLRGIRTLAPRMRVHSENAQAIAEWLEHHPRVRAVHYPGLANHPQHALATRQMSGFGGIVSFELDGDRDAVLEVARRVKTFTFTGSLGGVESILSYPALMSHVALSQKQRHALGIADGLIRLSVGIESADDLIADIGHALEA